MQQPVTGGDDVQGPRVSVVLPTYNERDNIRTVIRALRDIDRVEEVIVVDDDSPDGTADVVREMARADPVVSLIHRTGDAGLPSAIQEGIDAASGDRIGWMDCDLSHPPETVSRLMDALDEGADVAVGSRFVPGGGMEHGTLRWAMSREVCGLASLLLGRGIHDYTSGFVMADADVLRELGWSGDHLYGEYCIEFLYRAQQGHRVVEVPYISRPRDAGDSKTTASLPRLTRLGLRYHLLIAGLAVDRLMG